MLLTQVDIQKNFSPAQTFPTFSDLVNVLVKNLFVLAGVLVFIVFVYGGLKFLMSSGSGDEKEMEKGKQALTAAAIGFMLIFASFWIVEIIQFITGVKILNPGV